MKQPKLNLNNNVGSLDERENYFSYILSPYKNKHHKKKSLDCHKVETAIKHGDYKKCEGDINCEAEVFIRRKHKKKPLNTRKMKTTIKHDDYKKCEGDIDCEAEVFIQQKHKKFNHNNTTDQ
uniref:Uncharacterized protein n=1 Tax=Chenopodium quinoa TaxID=63459 RepID=A0A803M748_CHEQI